MLMQLQCKIACLLRSQRIALAIGLLALCPAAFAQQYKPEQILRQVPTQAGVDIDTPTAEETPNCKVRTFKEAGYQGIALYKPDGATLLRVWCAPGSSSKVEQIRYFKNGQEVYRDVLGKEARSIRRDLAAVRLEAIKKSPHGRFFLLRKPLRKLSQRS